MNDIPGLNEIPPQPNPAPPPSPAATSTPSAGFDFNNPTIVSLLYLSSFVLGVTSIVGVVLAYVWKGEPHPDWQDSHFQYLINTFWLGLVGLDGHTVSEGRLGQSRGMRAVRLVAGETAARPGAGVAVGGAANAAVAETLPQRQIA